MRAILQVTAVILLIGSVGWWWHAGSNKGWTKTSRQVWKYDEVTEISYPEIEKSFVPGVEFLAGAGLASALLYGTGFLLNRRKRTAE
jgi:hypothetical protein